MKDRTAVYLLIFILANVQTAANESMYRFDELVLRGIELED